MRHRLAGAGRLSMAAMVVGAVLGVIVAPALACAQDVTVVTTITANGRTSQSTQYISSTATRTAMGDGGEIILRMDQKKMFVLHPKQKTYSVMTFDEMQKMASAAAASMENLPPEAAAQMKKMMGGMSGGQVSVTDVGPGEKIAGYATEKYHVVIGTIMEGDVWAAPALALPPMFYDAMKATTPSNPMLDMKKLYEEYKKIQGMVLKSVTNTKMMGQAMTSTTVVTSVDKSPIPPATFEVPAGFQLTPMR